MKRVCISLAVVVAAVCLFTSFASATAVPPINPPQPGSYYYGDADGDTLLTTFDLGIMNNLFNGQNYTYGTLQPDNSNDDWNTSDLDSDNLLTTFDLGYFSNWFNGQALNIADKPWILSAANLRVTYATTGAFFAFNANVSANSGANGRPGVAVTANIRPVGSGSTVTGSIGGRNCAAVDLFDVAAPGAQCALAVTITDWTLDPTAGLTESGTYGLQVKADAPGTIAIQLDVSDNGLGIEAPTLQTVVTTRFVSAVVNHPPTFSTAPVAINVQAGAAYGPVTNGVVSDIDVGQQVSCASNGTNCIGFTPTVSGGPGASPQNCTISFTSQQPQVCQLRVRGSDNFAPAATVGATITITVGNRNPTFSTAPAAINVLAGVAYGPVTNGVVSDADTGQQVSCAANGTSCGFAITVTGGPGASPQNCTISFAAQSTPGTCNLRVRGSDNFAPAGTVGATIAVTIGNRNPTFSTAPAAISVAAGVAYGPVTNGVVSDADTGQQVSCAANGTSCGFAITVTGGPGASPQNCTISFAAQSTPGVCNLRVRGSDNFAPAGTVGATITVTIGNRNPTFSTAPAAISVAAGVAYGPVTNGVVSDADTGQQVSCAANGTSCGFAITVTGGPGASPQNCTISFAAQSTPGVCNLRVRGSDNFAPAGTVGATITVTIGNRNPTFSTAPAAINVLAGVAYGPVTNGVVSDADTGQQVSCAANGTSCGFAITVTGGPGASPQNCTISFAAQGTPGTCNLRVLGSDNFAPAGTVGATIAVTIGNRNPTFSTAPTNIGVATGVAYGPVTNGVVSDADTGQQVSCAANGTSCGFAVTVTGGPGASPQNCTISFAAQGSAQTCNLRVRGSDNFAPAGTVGATITITISANNSPTFSTLPVNITVAPGVAYGPVTNGVVSDVDVGQQVSCAANGTSCGFAITVTGGPGASPQNCTISFAAQTTPGTCNLRVRGSDNFAPAGTVGLTITVTVTNRNPTFSTAPANIVVASGVAYGPVTNGVVSDADTGQQVSCAANGTSCGFAVTVTGGPGASPQNCTISFAAQVTTGVCNLRVRGSDNFAPAGTVGATITITVNNAAPTFSTAPVAINVLAGAAYGPVTNGVVSDVNTGQQVTCASNGTNCVGFTPTVTGGPGASPQNCTITLTSQQPQTCNLRVMGSDNFAPAATVGATITITIGNRNPTFSTAPAAISVAAGVAYGPVTNGVVSDADTGQQVSCAANGTSCGFAITVTGGPGASPQNCTISFAAQGTPGVCNLRVRGSDNFAPAGTVGATITVTIGNRNPTFSTLPANISVAAGVAYGPVTNGVVSDADTGQQVSCAANGTSCGFAITVTGGPGASPQNCTISFAAQGTPGVCNLRVLGSDNFAPAGTVGTTITVTIGNRNPTFSTAPANIVVASGVAYGPVTNGVVSDADTGQQVSCAANGTSCGFAITVTGGPGASPQNCTISFAAQTVPGVCNLRVRGSDNFAPAGTVGATITVTVNNAAPTFSTAPAAINVLAGVAYGPVTNGVVSDVNTAQQVTCAANGTSCGFAITVTGGPGVPPQNCTMSFAAQSTPGTCNLRVMGSDNFAPAATVGTTITVTIGNRNPTFSTAPANIVVNSGVAYGPVTNGVVSDADTGQQVSCAANGTSCGFAITVTGGPGASPQNCTISFAAQTVPGVCNLRVRGSDNFAPAGTVGATITVTVNNAAPTFSTAPASFTLCPGSVYNATNGVATDINTAQQLTCTGSTSCGYAVTVSGGPAVPPVNCNMNTTVGGAGGSTCNVRVSAADNGAPSMSVGSTIVITTRAAGCGGGNNITYTGTSVTGVVGGINPAIARIKTNYPADFNQITLNFSGSPGATCSATVNCGAAVPVTGAVSGNNCVLTATAGFWTSNALCTISAITTAQTCTNCAGVTETFNTSLRTSECAPRGGTCGGFIDCSTGVAAGCYGSGNTLEVDTIDFRQYGGQRLFGAAGGHVYVLVEHPDATPAVKIEAFDGDDNGITIVSNGSTPALLSAPTKVTAAYKGNITGTCDNSLAEYPKCYRYTTWDNLDSRKINLPMEQTLAGGDWQMPDAQIWGYTPITWYSRMVGARPAGNIFPNPLRGGFAMLGLLDQSMAAIDLDQILRSTGDLSTLSLCMNALGVNIGGLSLPGNLILPDVIRQNWSAACAGNYKSSPANTTFRIFTNRPNIQRKLFVLGASVISTNFNVYKSLDIMVLPITMVAVGTATLNIPAINQDINLGDSGGTWLPGTAVPRSVPFEFDYRAPAQGIGRFVNVNEFGPPLDVERVRMGVAATPDYGDPNRQRAASHVGQFYTFGESIVVLGVRAGAAGLVPFQLVTTPMLDDAQFTVFQKMNANSKAFNDTRPWRNSSTNALTISATPRGLPSTAVDPDITWASAEPGVVGLLVRGFLEPYTSTGSAALPATVPGGLSNSQLFVNLEGINGTTVGAAVWIAPGEVTSPTHNGYYVPPQADSRGWPINRNGQLLRGTARMANDFPTLVAGGARLFNIRNPQANTTPARYADMYVLDLVDVKHIANNYSDTPRGQPDDQLWRYYGAVGGNASVSVSLPFIMPRRASLTGVNGIVPDPWEAGNMTNQTMEWSLVEYVIDTTARGINAAFKYSNTNIVWLYERTYLTGTEQHAFIWR